jgi:hypothetical protein
VAPETKGHVQAAPPSAMGRVGTPVSYSDLNRQAAARVTARLHAFEFSLSYYPDTTQRERRPAATVILTTPTAPAPEPRNGPPPVLCRITPEQAQAIVDCLAADGFFVRGEANGRKALESPKGPYSVISVSVERDVHYFDFMLAGPNASKQLEVLARQLDGDAEAAVRRVIELSAGDAERKFIE